MVSDASLALTLSS